MTSGPSSPEIAPPPVPADVGVVAALGIEINPFLARLSNVRKYSSERHTIVEGELSGKLVVAILSGPGRKAARRGAQLLLAGHRPRWMVSAGFGGVVTWLVLRKEAPDDGKLLGFFLAATLVFVGASTTLPGTDWFRERLQTTIQIEGYLSRRISGHTELKYSKHEAVLLSSAMYYAEDIPFLDRKKRKILTALEKL